MMDLCGPVRQNATSATALLSQLKTPAISEVLLYSKSEQFRCFPAR